MNPVLTRLLRGGRLESVHRGRYLLLGPDGPMDQGGDVGEPVIPRSALKLLQLLPLFASGETERLGLVASQSALLVASHSGDEGHVRAVRSLLARAGIEEEALCCGPHPPLDNEAAERLWLSGGRPLRIHNNCSGKHAGFLIRAAMLGAPLEGYLDPAHPVQVEVRENLEALLGVEAPPLATVTDGCGAPMYELPMEGLAAFFRDLANPGRLPSPFLEGAVRMGEALQEAPHFLAGRGRFDTALLSAAPGRFIGKCGAEGVFALGIRAEGSRPPMGLVVKIEDGNRRGYETWLPRYLEKREILQGTEEALRPFFEGEIRNTAGQVVGCARAEL